MNNEVDVNILIGVYQQNILSLVNQNILLEAKIQSLSKDFEKEKNILLMANLELQKKYDNVIGTKRKIKEPDKYEESGISQ